MGLFVRITPRSPRERLDGALYAFDLTEEQLFEQVIGPYDRGETIVIRGRSLPAADISVLEITEITDLNALDELRVQWTNGGRRATGDWIARNALSVTDRYVMGPAGRLRRSNVDDALSPRHAEAAKLRDDVESERSPVTGSRRRAPLFGRWKRLPDWLAIAADVITVGLFVLLLIGAARGIFSTTKPTSHAVTTSTPGQIASYGTERLRTGQIEQGDIYRAADITTRTRFSRSAEASCGQTVAFRVRIHNGGPDALQDVSVSASVNDGRPADSHGSVVSLKALNNLGGATVSATAGVHTPAASTAEYVRHSTELLDYSPHASSESVIRSLPDGLLSHFISIGTLGPLESDTVEVQFEVLLRCTS